MNSQYKVVKSKQIIDRIDNLSALWINYDKRNEFH